METAALPCTGVLVPFLLIFVVTVTLYSAAVYVIAVNVETLEGLAMDSVMITFVLDNIK